MTPVSAFELAPPDGVAHAVGIGPEGLGLQLAADGSCRIGDAADAAAVIRVDRRGIVLEVHPPGLVHVNGRPVRERALLRAGDSIVVGRCAFHLRTAAVPRSPNDETSVRRPAEGRPLPARAWLRCVVGRHAGQVRAVADGVELPWGPTPGGCRARISIENGCAVARGMRAGALFVDGHRLEAAVLAGGEQIVVGGEHYVVDGVALEPSVETEGPTASVRADTDLVIEEGTPTPRAPSGGFSPWWLLTAALAIAGSLVLLFGRV